MTIYTTAKYRTHQTIETLHVNGYKAPRFDTITPQGECTMIADLYINGRNVATFYDRGHCYEFIVAYLYANRRDTVVRQDESGERVYFWDAVNSRVDVQIAPGPLARTAI